MQNIGCMVGGGNITFYDKEKKRCNIVALHLKSSTNVENEEIVLTFEGRLAGDFGQTNSDTRVDVFIDSMVSWDDPDYQP